MNEFTGVISTISRKTEGYGDNLRTTGIRLTIEYNYLDEATGETEKATTELTFRFSMRDQFKIGDKVSFTIGSEDE
jgi:hypothetical protein